MSTYQIVFTAYLVWSTVVGIFYIYQVIQEKIKQSFLEFFKENLSILILLYVLALFITIIVTKEDLTLEF